MNPAFLTALTYQAPHLFHAVKYGMTDYRSRYEGRLNNLPPLIDSLFLTYGRHISTVVLGTQNLAPIEPGTEETGTYETIWTEVWDEP